MCQTELCIQRFAAIHTSTAVMNRTGRPKVNA